MKRVKIDEHLTYKKIIRIALPSIFLLLFVHVAMFVNGVFISNFGGASVEESNRLFEAYSHAQAYILIFFALAYITDYGGLAVISKSLGEGKIEEANHKYYTITWISLIIGIIITILSFVLLRPILSLIGAKGDILDSAVEIGSYMSAGLIFFTLHNFFRDIDLASEKQTRALVVTGVAEGCGLIISALLLIVFKVGIKGVGISMISVWVGLTIYYLIYYTRKNNSLVQIKKGPIKKETIIKTFSLALPAVTTELAMGIIALLNNYQAGLFLGDAGVIAMGACYSITDITFNICCGLVLALIPFFSYNYGAKRLDELKDLLKKSFVSVIVTGFITTLVIECLSIPLTGLYAKNSQELFDLIFRAITIYCAPTFLTFINYFISSYLIAMEKKSSYIGTFLRVIALWPTLVMALPYIFKNGNALWFVVLVTESLTLIINLIVLKVTQLGFKGLNLKLS